MRKCYEKGEGGPRGGRIEGLNSGLLCLLSRQKDGRVNVWVVVVEEEGDLHHWERKAEGVDLHVCASPLQHI